MKVSHSVFKMATSIKLKTSSRKKIMGRNHFKKFHSFHNRFVREAKEKEAEVLFVGDSLVHCLAFDEHNRFVFETKEKEPEVLFLGDSLIRNLAYTEIWKKMFEPLHCLNFGIGGDKTQNILWRVLNGELDCIEPKVIVLLAGTNNYEHTVEQVTGGILELVCQIQKKQERAQLVVMGIPPRGEHPNPLREKIAKVNASLAKQLKDIPSCTFLNVDPSMFVNNEGEISAHDMYDYLHMTKEGYQKLCEPLLDVIQDLLHDFVKVENTSLDVDSLAGDLATKVP